MQVVSLIILGATILNLVLSIQNFGHHRGILIFEHPGKRVNTRAPINNQWQHFEASNVANNLIMTHGAAVMRRSRGEAAAGPKLSLASVPVHVSRPLATWSLRVLPCRSVYATRVAGMRAWSTIFNIEDQRTDCAARVLWLFLVFNRQASFIKPLMAEQQWHVSCFGDGRNWIIEPMPSQSRVTVTMVLKQIMPLFSVFALGF